MNAVREVGMRGESLDFGQAVRDHYESVFRFCARRVGLQAAEDVAQDTFVAAQRSMRGFRGDSTVRTWLLGIAHNLCKRRSRAHDVKSPSIRLDETVGAVVGSEDCLIDRNALQTALNDLSAEHREVVLLHEVEGLTYAEAGAVLGVPEGTVKSRLHHAFLNLRKALQSPDVADAYGDNR